MAIRSLLIWMLSGVVLLLPTASVAHFTENTKPRTVILAIAPDGGLVAYVRMPAPLLYAADVVAAQEQQVRFEAEFLETRRIGHAITFRLSQQAVAADPAAFAARLAAAHEWQQNGLPVASEVVRWQLHAELPEVRLSSAADAIAALEGPAPAADPAFGEAYVDFELRIATAFPRSGISLRSMHPPLPLPPAISIDNHIRDARVSPAVSIIQVGQLQDWVSFEGSALRAAASFVWQGALHIIQGLDHVFLVVCIALGAGGIGRLVALVTAFTLGHAVTLVATFVGFVPSAPWFIPAVETAIAATVVYAAIAAWLGRLETPWIMAGVGLLHGLGFSFVLSKLLGPDAPGLVLSLASFTVGIELGQLAILAATLGLFWVLTQTSVTAEFWARRVTLGGLAAAAGVWVVQRGLFFV